MSSRVDCVVKWMTKHKTYLCQEVTKSPPNKRSKSLSGQRSLIKSIVVSSPSWNSASSDLRITEERTLHGGILAESRLESSSLFGGVWLEGTNREKRGNNSEEG